MSIDFALLTKAAKVYEAAEAVEGTKPKEVYESHKKCTPGEFGMNKEGSKKQADFDLDNALTGALGLGGVGAVGGAGVGGLYGLVSGMRQSPQGKKLRGALSGLARGAGGGALVGGGLGAGAGAGMMVGLPKGITENQITFNGVDSPAQQKINKDPMKYLTRVLGLGGLGLVGGGLVGDEVRRHTIGDADEKDDKDEKSAAFNFGTNVLPGAGIGAALGGLYGLVAPGEDTDYDNEGNPIRRRPRSRMSAMLRGVLGGGAVGGLGGLVADKYAPNLGNDAYNWARQYFTGKNQAQLNTADNVAKMTPRQQTVHRQATRGPSPFTTSKMPEQMFRKSPAPVADTSPELPLSPAG